MAFFICERPVPIPDFMCKNHETDMFTLFYFSQNKNLHKYLEELKAVYSYLQVKKNSVCFAGFVIARPFRIGEEAGECMQISFYKVMGSSKSQVKVYQRNALSSLSKSDFLKERRFIIKAQLPIGMTVRVFKARPHSHLCSLSIIDYLRATNRYEFDIQFSNHQIKLIE